MCSLISAFHFTAIISFYPWSHLTCNKFLVPLLLLLLFILWDSRESVWLKRKQNCSRLIRGVGEVIRRTKSRCCGVGRWPRPRNAVFVIMTVDIHWHHSKSNNFIFKTVSVRDIEVIHHSCLFSFIPPSVVKYLTNNVVFNFISDRLKWRLMWTDWFPRGMKQETLNSI